MEQWILTVTDYNEQSYQIIFHNLSDVLDFIRQDSEEGTYYSTYNIEKDY